MKAKDLAEVSRLIAEAKRCSEMHGIIANGGKLEAFTPLGMRQLEEYVDPVSYADALTIVLNGIRTNHKAILSKLEFLGVDTFEIDELPTDPAGLALVADNYSSFLA